MDPAFFIFRGIISETTTKGNVSTPQQAINITNEKLVTGIHENDSSIRSSEFKYMKTARQSNPRPVPIADIVSKIFKVKNNDLL